MKTNHSKMWGIWIINWYRNNVGNGYWVKFIDIHRLCSTRLWYIYWKDVYVNKFYTKLIKINITHKRYQWKHVPWFLSIVSGKSFCWWLYITKKVKKKKKENKKHNFPTQWKSKSCMPLCLTSEYMYVYNPVVSLFRIVQL